MKKMIGSASFTTITPRFLSEAENSQPPGQSVV